MHALKRLIIYNNPYPRSHHSHDLVNTIMQLLITPTLDLVILPYTSSSRLPCWVPAGLCFVSPLFFFWPLFYHKDAVKYLSPSNNSICECDQQNCCWCTSRRLNFDFCTSSSYITPPALQISIYNQIHNVWKIIILILIARGYGIIVLIAIEDMGNKMGSMTKETK